LIKIENKIEKKNEVDDDDEAATTTTTTSTNRAKILNATTNF